MRCNSCKQDKPEDCFSITTHIYRPPVGPPRHYTYRRKKCRECENKRYMEVYKARRKRVRPPEPGIDPNPGFKNCRCCLKLRPICEFNIGQSFRILQDGTRHEYRYRRQTCNDCVYERQKRATIVRAMKSDYHRKHG